MKTMLYWKPIVIKTLTVSSCQESISVRKVHGARFTVHFRNHHLKKKLKWRQKTLRNRVVFISARFNYCHVCIFLPKTRSWNEKLTRKSTLVNPENGSYCWIFLLPVLKPTAGWAFFFTWYPECSAASCDLPTITTGSAKKKEVGVYNPS